MSFAFLQTSVKITNIIKTSSFRCFSPFCFLHSQAQKTYQLTRYVSRFAGTNEKEQDNAAETVSYLKDKFDTVSFGKRRIFCLTETIQLVFLTTEENL